MSVPNQLIVTVYKDKTDREHPYSCIALEAIDYAAIHLRTVGAFKLWLYIAKNQNQYEFELSRTAFCAWSGLSPSAYQDAMRVLRARGYLVPSLKQKNRLTFYEFPLIQEMSSNKNDFIIDMSEQKIKDCKYITKTFKF